MLASFGTPEAPDERGSFLDELFRNKQRFLEDDPFRTIGGAGSFFTKIVGVSFEGRQDVVAGLREGDTLALVRQPENPHDSNAIGVHYGSLHLGFLRKQIAKHLAPVMDAGTVYRASVGSVTGGGGKHFGVNIFVRKDRAAIDVKGPAERSLAGDDAIRVALIGSNDLRPAQREVIDRVMGGRNTLAVLGTGRGKSFCFQYPATVRALRERQKTLVLYPLRALGNDQFEAMQRRLGGSGLRLFRANGSIGEDERYELMEALASGLWDLIMSTPEFLAYHIEMFAEARNRPSLLVVDEAHHLFESRHRSAYGELSGLLARLGSPQVLALTATANNDVFKHVREKLGIDAWVVDPTVRENLHVLDARACSDKHAYLERELERGKSIVYCNSRTEATRVAETLRRAFGNTVAFYHAGMGTQERTTVEAFFRDDALRVVVATSAFGEGIDLPDIRHVVLYHLNFSFTEFNQQAGRAGRDGADASIHLLYGEQDRRINDFLIARSAPSLGVLREIYRGLRGLAPGGTLRQSYTEIARMLDIDLADATTIGVALRIFEEAGLVKIGLDDEGRFAEFVEVKERVDLTRTARFAESQAERESFDGFCGLALTADAPVLERIINRPIYPDNVPLLR